MYEASVGRKQGQQKSAKLTLLAEGEMPLKRIAARLGFANPASFSLAFRRLTGSTPGRYRAIRRGLN